MITIKRKEVIIMADFEQVQKLREYANISYEEAKKALEEANGDMLEAIINLEKQGRIKAPETGGYYNSQHEKKANGDSCRRNSWEKKTAHTNGSSFGDHVSAFFKWCGKVIHKGNINSFEVTKDGKRILTLPVTALVLMLVFAFWLVVLLLVLGLFFGYQYRFRGPDLEKPEVNRAMENVSRATTKAVDSMVNAVDQITKDVKKDKGECDGAHPDH
jgi:hypothetical protein